VSASSAAALAQRERELPAPGLASDPDAYRSGKLSPSSGTVMVPT
jgi:hypothetical protein